MTATVFRGDELLEVGLVLQAAPLDTVLPRRCASSADPKALERRRAWLGE